MNNEDNLVTFAVFVMIILQPTVVWKPSTTTLPLIPPILHITLPAVIWVSKDAGSHGR